MLENYQQYTNVSKLIEKSITIRLENFIDGFNILYPSEHGFTSE